MISPSNLEVQQYHGGAAVKFVWVLQEQSHTMHAVEENKVQENQRESAAAPGRERM